MNFEYLEYNFFDNEQMSSFDNYEYSIYPTVYAPDFGACID